MADSTHESVQDALVALLKDAALTAVGARVYKQRVLDTLDFEKLPAVSVNIEGLAEEERDGNFEDWEVGYPVRVVLVDRAVAHDMENDARVRRIRQEILRVLRPIVSLSGVSGVWDSELRNDPVYDPALPKGLMVLSSVVITVLIFETY